MTPLSGRALFQSPRFSSIATTTVAVTTDSSAQRSAYEISGWGLILRFAVTMVVLYFEFTRSMK
jgi:hypothetical protein